MCSSKISIRNLELYFKNKNGEGEFGDREAEIMQRAGEVAVGNVIYPNDLVSLIGEEDAEILMAKITGDREHFEIVTQDLQG